MQKVSEMKKLIPLLLLIILLAGCAKSDNTKSDKLQIVAIDFPSYDAARFLLSDEAELSLLLPPGSDMHHYDPTPKDMIKVSNADLVIFTGGESDEWVYRILESTESESYFTLISAVELLNEEHVEGMELEEEEEGEEIDEHVWTSPINEISILSSLSDKLTLLTGDDVYKERFEVVEEELRALDEEFRAIVDKATLKTLIFASRFPLRYFFEEYGLKYYAAFPGCAEESEPSAKTVAFLIDKAKELDVPLVLNIELSSSLIANTIAREAGVKVRTFNSIHNVTPEEFNRGENYITLMRQNAVVLKEALRVD